MTFDVHAYSQIGDEEELYQWLLRGHFFTIPVCKFTDRRVVMN